ncbi:Mu transposase C-terminal domain-containing protein, partial [Vibrio cholerae]
LDAKLSISDFKEIILSSILYHNQFAVLGKYDRSDDMPVDLPSVPIELWRWGIQHRTDRLRAAPERELRLSLLPRARATISPLGICLFGLYYTCAEAMSAGWMHRGKATARPEKVTVAYDPNIADEIYLFPVEGKSEFWVGKLSDRSREFIHCSFWEVWQIQARQKSVTATSKVVSDEKKRAHERRVIDKIQQAEARSPDVSEFSKSERIAAIRPNRKAELESEREDRKPTEPSQPRERADVVHLPGVEEEDYQYPSFVSELFDDEDDQK